MYGRKSYSLLILLSLLCFLSGSGDKTWSQQLPSKNQCQSQDGGWQPPPTQWGPPPPQATSVFHSADPGYMSSYQQHHQQKPDQQQNQQAAPQPSQQQGWQMQTPTRSPTDDIPSITSSGIRSLIQDLQPCASPQLVVPPLDGDDNNRNFLTM